MKKLFKYLGFGLLSVIIFFVGVFIFSAIVGVDKEEVFIPYIEKTTPKLITWEIDEYKKVMSGEGFEAATPEQWSLYLNNFSKLGIYKSMGTPTLENYKTMSGVSDGVTSYAVYLVPLEFNTGSAHVRLTLGHNNEKTEVHGAQFLSDLLLE
ncbi:MAG: hypothetical protein KBT53_08055 [Porticoccus sp.]|nr:hypothetical protein [Porticoccus sp.]MBQ0808337.1 hypothetical protein [Porticoccus sp.]